MASGRHGARWVSVLCLGVAAVVAVAGCTRAASSAGSRSSPSASAGRTGASVPACTVMAVDAAAGLYGPGRVRLACADGWALLTVGQGQYRVIELLRAHGPTWRVEPVANGRDLDYAPQTLRVRLVTLTRLATRLGPVLRPFVAAARIVARLANSHRAACTPTAA